MAYADNGEVKKRSWQVPKYLSASKEEIHEWVIGQVNDGLDYQQASPGYKQIEESIRILTGDPTEELAQKQKNRGYSKAQTNRLKRNLREMVNALSEIRYNPGYHADNNTVYEMAKVFNDVAFSWYVNEFVDLDVKEALQWAAISPCGWMEIGYRQIPGEGKQEIDCTSHSWFDVVMTGVPETGRFQEAYTVTIIKDLPVYLAHALWPDYQEKLKPDRETPKGWWGIIKEKAKQALKGAFDTSQEATTAKNPTVRLYYQYVIDLSINRTGKTMKMGYEKRKNAAGQTEEFETPWSYEVPYVGQPIKRGFDDSGNPKTEPAAPKDCRIFPGRRLLVDSETDNIYDGPSFDFHGRVPLIKICADAWPFGEFSMVHDVAPIHEEIQEIDRISNQTLRNRFNPTMGYNTRAVNRDQAKTVRLDVQGDRIGFNGEQAASIDKAMSPLVPATFNVIEPWVEARLKYLMDQEDYQMGVRNFEALAKLKIGAAGDSIDKLLEAAGPIVKGISRDMERSMRDLADMFKYLVLQYKTTPEIMQITGPDGITPVNIDYDPGNLIPSHLPGEKKSIQVGFKLDGSPIEKFLPSSYTKMQRARWAAEHVKFIITPGTLHEITQTAQKMLFLQLWRAGFPIDPWTLADVLRIGNLGPKPEGTNSMLERWHAFKMMEVEFQAALAAKMKQLMGEDGGGMPNAPGLGGKGGAKGSGGRAASGQAEPRLASKDGGSRTIVRESR